MVDLNRALDTYQGSLWLRALIQLIPSVGSPVDTLLAGRASKINQQRVDELIAGVSERVDNLAKTLPAEFLGSEAFFELFRTAAEIVARSADTRKREVVAEYLSGVIRGGAFTDIEAQVLEDLQFLQPLHLQVLAALPAMGNVPVSKRTPPESLTGISSVRLNEGVNR